MTRKRRNFSTSFKAKVALAAARGDRSTAELASKFGIHTSQVTAWKKLLLAGAPELFADGRARQAESSAAEQELDVDPTIHPRGRGYGCFLASVHAPAGEWPWLSFPCLPW